jgi:hypothetical protein
MVVKFYQSLFSLAFLVLIYSCSASKKASSNLSTGISAIKFISEYDLPHNMEFKGTIVGGLSGIDYDAGRNLYYMISDDPSTKGPTRCYTARIAFTEKGIDSVKIVDMTPLLDENGNTYADITKDRVHSADVEAMRYDDKRDELIWSSEGQRYIRDSIKDLENPAIVIMDRGGHFKDSFDLPSNMHIQLQEKGPRHNEVFEGLSFDENHSHVFVSLESPIYEDGPRAAGGDTTAWIRILKFNRKLKQSVAQYAYQIDAVPYPANPPGAFKVNGVSDILYTGNDKFIVIERGYSTGRGPSDVRIYLADAKGAEDISFQSLSLDPPKHPLAKKLLLDMNALERYIDNVEGVTFGPNLSNGHRTLVFVTDDNFAAKQKTQFFLFEILP